MDILELGIKTHNFYLIGKENYISGKTLEKISRSNLPPTTYNFGETIQEIGLDIKLQYEKFKYDEKNEIIGIFEPFHFKDFDSKNLNLWTFQELLFHQGYLFGVSFNTNKIEIYESLLNYLISIYGKHQTIPDQDNSNSIAFWHIGDPHTLIHLEIEKKESGEDFIVLTYYDVVLQMTLSKNFNIYPLVRDEAYQRDKKFKNKTITNTQKNQSFISKLFKRNTTQLTYSEPNFNLIKQRCENILSKSNSKQDLEKITNYLIANISPNCLNLEIGDWLMKIAIKIQESFLLKESEQIYNLFTQWHNTPNFNPTKERIELIASAYKNLINVYGDSSKSTDAISSFNNCVQLLDKYKLLMNNYNYTSIVAQANYNIAIVYNNNKKIEKAIEHNQKAFDYIELFVAPWMNSSNISTIIVIVLNLSNYYSENLDYQKAGENLTMGMRFAFDHNRYYDASIFIMNLAITFVKQQKYHDAETQYNVILDLMAKAPQIYDNTPFEGQLMVNMANMYKTVNDLDKETQCLNSAIAFYENISHYHPEIKNLLDTLKKRKTNTNK